MIKRCDVCGAKYLGFGVGKFECGRQDGPQCHCPRTQEVLRQLRDEKGLSVPKPFLEVGEVVELTPEHEVYGDVPEKSVYSNRPNSNVLAHVKTRIGVPTCPAGKYVVVQAAFRDGSSVHERGHSAGYPNGWHVFCVNAENQNIKVDFYQSGSFTAMIENIQPVGRAICQWVVVEEI